MKRVRTAAGGRRGVLLAGALIAILAIAASSAYAFFSSSAAGAGQATVAALQPVTVAALVNGDSPSGSLLPGGTADVILRVNNPNNSAVTLVRVTGSGPVTPDSAHSSCTTSGVSLTDQTGLSTTIAASGTTLVRLPNAASMSTASSSGCQGATFSIPVSITVHR